VKVNRLSLRLMLVEDAFGSTIDFGATANMANINDSAMIIDTVNDPIITRSETPQACSTR